MGGKFNYMELLEADFYVAHFQWDWTPKSGRW